MSEQTRRERRLRAITASWRETAAVWEQKIQHDDWYVGKHDAHQPPEKYRGAIRNWISWLNGQAAEIDAALDATQEDA